MIVSMRTLLAILPIAFLATATAYAQEIVQLEISGTARVRIETTMGDIVVELNADRAPLTVQSFLQNVVDGWYDGTIFHRVAPGFLIQGGGFLPDLTRKPSDTIVFNESGNGLSNRRGTIGMARSEEPHAASTEFYFNLVDNFDLDPKPTRWGYAVFGEIVEGLDVMDRIGSVPTGAAGEFDRNVPIETIIIERITLIRE
jgi:cyclophilin family peptidyl-prolyl cis-trans isomerase